MRVHGELTRGGVTAGLERALCSPFAWPTCDNVRQAHVLGVALEKKYICPGLLVGDWGLTPAAA